VEVVAEAVTGTAVVTAVATGVGSEAEAGAGGGVTRFRGPCPPTGLPFGRAPSPSSHRAEHTRLIRPILAYWSRLFPNPNFRSEYHFSGLGTLWNRFPVPEPPRGLIFSPNGWNRTHVWYVLLLDTIFSLWALGTLPSPSPQVTVVPRMFLSR